MQCYCQSNTTKETSVTIISNTDPFIGEWENIANGSYVLVTKENNTYYVKGYKNDPGTPFKKLEEYKLTYMNVIFLSYDKGKDQLILSTIEGKEIWKRLTKKSTF